MSHSSSRARVSSHTFGLTLVEVVASITIFSLVILGVAAALASASRVAREVKERIIVQGEATNLLALVASLYVGSSSDPAATAAQLDARLGEEGRGVVWCGVVWCGVVWCGVVW